MQDTIWRVVKWGNLVVVVLALLGGAGWGVDYYVRSRATQVSLTLLQQYHQEAIKLFEVRPTPLAAPAPPKAPEAPKK